KFDPHPAVALVSPAITPRHHGVGESEERSVIAALRGQSFYVELKLVVEHCLEPGARNVPVDVSVDGVADFHVVSRDAFRDRARGAANPKKPAHYFLARANLRKGAVPARIKIDPKRLGMGIDRLLFHGVRIGDVLNPGRAKRESFQ